MSCRGALVVVSVLLTAGCTGTAPEVTSAAGPVASTAASPAPAPSPSPTSERIDVGVDGVAGVPVGTPADEAEQQLTKALGRPVVQVLPGCNGETGRSLTWGSLTAFLSDGGQGGAVALRGWVVASGPDSESLALPYDTAVGQTTDQVVTAVPAARGQAMTEGPYAEAYLVTTPEAPGLLGRADAEAGVVDEVAFEPEVCD